MLYVATSSVIVFFSTSLLLPQDMCCGGSGMSGVRMHVPRSLSLIHRKAWYGTSDDPWSLRTLALVRKEIQTHNSSCYLHQYTHFWATNQVSIIVTSDPYPSTSLSYRGHHSPAPGSPHRLVGYSSIEIRSYTQIYTMPRNDITTETMTYARKKLPGSQNWTCSLNNHHLLQTKLR